MQAERERGTKSRTSALSFIRGMNRTKWIAVAILSLICMSEVAAQNYPTPPVTIIVPYAAGGGTDLLARMIGQNLEQRKSFVVENRLGGGTVIRVFGWLYGLPPCCFTTISWLIGEAKYDAFASRLRREERTRVAVSAVDRPTPG